MTDHDGSHSHLISELLRRLLGAGRDDICRAVEQRATLLEIKSGAQLFRQGDVGDSMYIVLHGRLRVSIRNDDGTEHIVNEITRNQSVGEMALFTNEPRSASVAAIRNSTLLKLLRADFEALAEQFPAFALAFSRQVIERFSRSIRGGPARISPATNIALIKRTAGIDFARTAAGLIQALETAGRVLAVHAEHAANQASEAFSRWLDEQEDRYDFIVLLDSGASPAWTSRVIQHADKLLLAGAAGKTTCPALLQHPDLQQPSAAAQWLFVHTADRSLPSDTPDTPAARHRQLHIRQDNTHDYARLARCISGRAVALVLAGGGARALAHVGVYRALCEAGLPVDLVGGTSMGAVVGALIAMDLDHRAMTEHLRHTFIRSKPLSDYTLPLVALLRGRRLSHVCAEYFGNRRIEDLWRNFFCVSANITTDETCVHDSGLIWEAIRATTSLPGVVPPVVRNNQLLVDGGVANNLPVDLMIERGASKVIAVDLGTGQRRFEVPGTTYPGTVEILKQQYRPGQHPSQHPAAPRIAEIIHKSVLLGSIQRTRRNRRTADICLALPVERFGLLSFSRIEEIIEAGYEHSVGRMADIRAALNGTPSLADE